MTNTGNAPTWAIRLVEKHAPGTPLTWRRLPSLNWGTDGLYHRGAIQVTQRARSSEDDNRVVVLHEIAHCATIEHDDRFYREFYRLLRAEGLERHALDMPYGYREGLTRAAREAA